MWRNRLAEARRRQGLTQRALALRLGVAESHVSRWEHGERLPSLPWALRLARVLGHPVEWLFWEDEE